MSNISSDHAQLLDILQSEVNQVLEQTGRVFLAYARKDKTVYAAQANKVNRFLPGCINRFNTALDQLQNDLQLAQSVMRRDLAVLRERSKFPQAPQASQEEDTTVNLIADFETALVKDDATSSPIKPETITSVDDVVMQDDAADMKVEAAPILSPSADALPSPGVLAADPNTTSSPPALQVDTQTSQNRHTSDNTNPALDNDDKEPDTGTYTNDFESLFGGPTSADPQTVPEGDTGELQHTTFDAGTTDFDPFDPFDGTLPGNTAGSDTVGQDEIAALLPGIQDFADTQRAQDDNGSGETGVVDTGEETDFDALFGTIQQSGDQQQPARGQEQQDSNFDDLMNFGGFNANFDTTDDNKGDDDGDFDFSFD